MMVVLAWGEMPVTEKDWLIFIFVVLSREEAGRSIL